MTLTSLSITFLMIVTTHALALSSSTTRRAFVLVQTPAFLVGGSAVAYERRDVGGTDRSPETAALNEQAYLTNNRLEREGFRLESATEQQASLSAALSQYSYSESTTKNKNKKTQDKEKTKKD